MDDKQAILARARAAIATLHDPRNEKPAVLLFQQAILAEPSQADLHMIMANIVRSRPELGVDMDAFNARIPEKQALQAEYHKLIADLVARKDFNAALFGQEELCRLFPHSAIETRALAELVASLGDKQGGLSILAHALMQAPDDREIAAVFVQSCRGVWLDGFDPAIKAALQLCFGQVYQHDLMQLYSVWTSMLFSDPACAGIKQVSDRVDALDGGLPEWLQTAGPEALAFLGDPFFLEGLRVLRIANPFMENLLVALRDAFCRNALAPGFRDQLGRFEPFLCALAEQCFYNEYVYPVSDAKNGIIDQLLAAGISQNGPARTLVALTGCYRGLLDAFPDGTFPLELDTGESAGFHRLVTTAILEPLEERQLTGSLETFGSVEDTVSRAVQALYEEHPYPRWTSFNIYPPDASVVVTGNHGGSNEILVAGCGTGRQLFATVAENPGARITAIDISRTSLAYARRKAIDAGIADRIRFLHADILSMADWPEQFDIVESTGVLHHMADPFAAWQMLTDRLKPGGRFKVALYSEIARSYFAQVQQMVRDQDIPPTAEGIRALRAAILARPQHDALRQNLVSSGDFYTVSAIRDLVFHVQEHRFTLPQIEEMLGRLGLEFESFLFSDSEVTGRYDAMFPDDPQRANLANWHQYEQRNPETFLGTYMFWCRKK